MVNVLRLKGAELKYDVGFLTHNFIILYYPISKEIGDEEPYYNTKILIFSFTWAGLAAFHKASTI